MTPPILLILIALGLILWLAPFTGWAARLNDVGRWCAILSFIAWLWSKVGA